MPTACAPIILSCRVRCQVCGGPALTLFRSEELKLLVCGLPHLDFEDLQTVARYSGGYNQQHSTIRASWATPHAFSLPEKKLYLKFTTDQTFIHL